MQAVSKVKAGAAPSGIPISTQNLVIYFGVGDIRNGTYAKNPSLNIWLELIETIYQIHAPNAFFANTTWAFYDDNVGDFTDPTNSSTNPNFIPTSGWINPSITITAA